MLAVHPGSNPQPQPSEAIPIYAPESLIQGLGRKGGLLSRDLWWIAQVNTPSSFLFFLQALVGCLFPCECRTLVLLGGAVVCRDFPLIEKEGWGTEAVTDFTLALHPQGAKSSIQGVEGRP